MPKSKSKSGVGRGEEGKARRKERGSHKGGKNLRGTKRSPLSVEGNSDCRCVELASTRCTDR